MLGRTFANRYKIIKQIGNGGMAEVYLAEDTLLDKFVALKILKKEFVDNRSSLRYFKNEAEAISQLSHPNIVEVYDMEMAEGNPYIVMEYVEGKTLKDIINKKGPLSEIFAIHIMEGILSALIHSHKHGVIHRDIKPHNIMINKDGEIKVMDFGIARMTNQNSTVTLSTDIVGSVHYLSPEQAAGKEVHETSDIYSAGIVLYEMLTGKLPYDGDNPVSVAVSHIQGQITPPKEYNDSICQEMENVVLKATLKDPKKRFKSAMEMSIILNKIKELLEQGKVNNVPRINLELPKKKKEKEDLKKTTSFKFIGAIILIMLLGVLVVGGIIAALNNGKEALVPDVTGKPYEEAVTILKDSGFKKIEKIEENSEDIPLGEVIRQSPGPQEAGKLKNPVKLYVSIGQGDTEIPDVVGLKSDDAKKKLEEEGFVCVVKQEFSDSVDLGLVISQDPSSEDGKKVAAGSTITIIVSKGAEVKVGTVPDLVGQTQSSAETSLKNSKLVLGKVTTEVSNLPEGTVISQSVAAGVEVKEGTKVDIKISKVLTKKTQQFNYEVTPDGITTHKLRFVVADEKGTRETTATMGVNDNIYNGSVEYYGTGTLVIYDNGAKQSTLKLK